MAVILYDGFDHYATYNTGNSNFFEAANNWVVTSGSSNDIQLAAGRFANSLSLYFNSSADTIKRSLGTARSSLSVGMAFKQDRVNGNNACLQLFNGTTVILSVGVLSSGAVQAVRASTLGSNIICTSASSGLIVTNTWNYLEVELVRNASSGSINIYLNNALVASASTANTGSSDIDGIGLAVQASQHSWFDDLYVTDTSTRLGECRVESLIPDADDSTAWTATLSSTIQLVGRWSGSTTPYVTFTTPPRPNNKMLAMGFTDTGGGGALTYADGWEEIYFFGDTLTGNSGSSYALAKTVDNDLIGSNNGNGTSFSLNCYVLSSSYGSMTTWNYVVEIPYDGDIATDADVQHVAATGGVTPATYTPSEDVTIFMMAMQTGGTTSAIPVFGGTTYDYLSSDGTSLGGRSAAFAIVDVDSGVSITPTITWSGTPTKSVYIMVAVPRQKSRTGSNHVAVWGGYGNADTTKPQYALAASSGLTDQFTLSNLSSDPEAILAVKAVVIAKKDDATTRTITPNINSGGTAGAATAYNLTTSLTMSESIYEVDPNTSAAWTTSGVNNLKLNYTSG